jgi:hypothetical protein
MPTEVVAPRTPIALSSVLSDLQFAEEQAAKIIARTSPAQASWQPNAGRSWSIVQCLSHLARTDRIYAAAMYEAVAQLDARPNVPPNGISPGFLSARFIRSLEPPVRTRMKAPAKICPLSHADPNETFAEFVDSHKAVRIVIEAASGADINRVRFKNPFVPLVRFTVGTGLLVICAHDRRHLWQATQVAQTTGFPAS